MNWESLESEEHTFIHMVIVVIIAFIFATAIFFAPLIYVLVFQPSLNDIPTPLFQRK